MDYICDNFFFNRTFKVYFLVYFLVFLNNFIMIRDRNKKNDKL